MFEVEPLEPAAMKNPKMMNQTWKFIIVSSSMTFCRVYKDTGYWIWTMPLRTIGRRERFTPFPRNALDLFCNGKWFSSGPKRCTVNEKYQTLKSRKQTTFNSVQRFDDRRWTLRGPPYNELSHSWPSIQGFSPTHSVERLCFAVRMQVQMKSAKAVQVCDSKTNV